MKPKRFDVTLCSRVGTKCSIALIIGMVALQIGAPGSLKAQPQTQVIPRVNVKVVESSDEPQAVVVSVRGKCEYSEDGKAFSALKDEHVLNEGATIRTGDDGRADVFFRRIGTTVRLQRDTEIKIEKLVRHMKDGNPVMETLLDVKKGRIFTAVRSFVPGSKFEIKNAAGRSVVEGGGTSGRYIITADGTQVTDKSSDTLPKGAGGKGITIINPGQKVLAKDGKALPQNPPEEVSSMIEFDELHALAEKWDKPQARKN